MRLAEHDGEDGVSNPDEAAPAERGRPDPRRRRAGPGDRRGDALAGRPADQEAARAARPHHRQPVLRGLHPHPDLVRGGRQAALGRRHQLLRQGLLAEQGRVAQGHRADPGGDGRRRGRGPALGLGRTAPAGARRLVEVLGGQRRRRHPRAPDPGAARRVHDVAAPRPRRGASTAAGSRSSATCCTAGWRAPTRCCCRRSAPRSPWSRRRRCCRTASTRWGVDHVVRPRRGAAQGRRGDDAARAAGADERRVLPDRARVQPALRPRRTPDGDAPGPHDRDAPRPDDPRHGDHRRRRRLRALGDRRAGHQRRRRPDGRAVPAARRVRARHRRRRA